MTPTKDTPLIRKASAIMAALVPVLALAWVLKLPMRTGLLIFPEQVAAVMLALSISAIYLNSLGKRGLPAWVDLAASVLSLVMGGWVFVRFQVLSENAFMHPTESLILGIILVALVVDTVRRVIGWVLVGILGLFVAYAMFGDHMPAALAGRSMTLSEVLQYLATDSSATWGSSLQVAAFVVVIFVMFGGVLIAVGGGDFFTQLALRVSGTGPGSAAKIGVIASGLFGSISGSAVSNVMSTGVMTIPMMIRSGVPARTAGAIEAVASTGGQLMPPIMGAAAFLMAEVIQVPYSAILIAALIPAVIYYISVFLQIDFMSRREGIGTLSDVIRQTTMELLRQGWISILGFVVLLSGLFVFHMPAEVAACWTIFVMIAVAVVAHLIEPRLPGALTWWSVWRTFSGTGFATAEVILVTTAAGMIVGILGVTGLGFSLSILLLDLGGQTMLGMLVCTALVAILLGLGLPTTAVYLLLASLAAPALVQIGIPVIPAHMFVFYFGMLSMITPPIALASFAAAAISKAGQLRTSVESFRIGWVAYILPFLFIYKPALLMEGTPLEIIYVAVSSLIALFLVAGGALAHALQPVHGVMRLVWIVVGMLTLLPLSHLGGPVLEGALSCCGAVLVIWHLVRHGRAARTAPQPEVC